MMDKYSLSCHSLIPLGSEWWQVASFFSLDCTCLPSHAYYGPLETITFQVGIRRALTLTKVALTEFSAQKTTQLS